MSDVIVYQTDHYHTDPAVSRKLDRIMELLMSTSVKGQEAIELLKTLNTKTNEEAAVLEAMQARVALLLERAITATTDEEQAEIRGLVATELAKSQSVIDALKGTAASPADPAPELPPEVVTLRSK